MSYRNKTYVAFASEDIGLADPLACFNFTADALVQRVQLAKGEARQIHGLCRKI